MHPWRALSRSCKEEVLFLPLGSGALSPQPCLCVLTDARHVHFLHVTGYSPRHLSAESCWLLGSLWRAEG